MSAVKCSICGQNVSQNFGVDVIVRAWVECPECVASAKKQRFLFISMEDDGVNFFAADSFVMGDPVAVENGDLAIVCITDPEELSILMPGTMDTWVPVEESTIRNKYKPRKM